MLWGWFDSADKNFPHPLDAHLVACLFSMIDPLLTTLLPTTPSLWNGRENSLFFGVQFLMFLCNNDHFAKTGSGRVR